jgi:hypothetical protein
VKEGVRAVRFGLLVALSLGGMRDARAQAHPRSAMDSILAVCVAHDTSTRWREVSARWGDARTDRWRDSTLRQRLLALRDSDQVVRSAPSLADSLRDSSFVRRMARRDSLDRRALLEIIAAHGWPGRSLVGSEAASAAFLIAQHNDSLQPRALALMRAMPAGEVSPADLALLEDRVRVHRGEKQRFGTQMHPTPDGRALAFDPIEDPAHLEERRAAAGLPPLSTYRCLMRASYGRDVLAPEIPQY